MGIGVIGLDFQAPLKRGDGVGNGFFIAVDHSLEIKGFRVLRLPFLDEDDFGQSFVILLSLDQNLHPSEITEVRFGSDLDQLIEIGPGGIEIPSCKVRFPPVKPGLTVGGTFFQDQVEALFRLVIPLELIKHFSPLERVLGQLDLFFLSSDPEGKGGKRNDSQKASQRSDCLAESGVVVHGVLLFEL